MPKENLKIFYHVFTDNQDTYFDTEKEAYQQFKTWKKAGYRNIRVWKEGEYWKNGKPTEDFVEIECLESIGEWPA